MAEIRTPGPEKIEFHSDRQRHLLVDNSSATQVDSAVVTGVTTTFRIKTLRQRVLMAITINQVIQQVNLKSETL